ncbi:MAG: hypothetical protein HYY24_01715 [Verrucomicrobia bacterium]|nr:hypothetical protein [Verrucomicrobiota bacterium]
MTPFRETLTDDADIAAILTYVRGNPEWGNKASPVTAAQVKVIRDRTADHGPAYSPEELLSFPENE